MQDEKNSIQLGYMLVGLLGCLMGIHYIGVVRPEWLVPNFLLDFLAPMSFEYDNSIRLWFVFIHLGVSLLAPASSDVEDKVSKSVQLKAVMVVLLLISTYFLLTIENYPLIMFTMVYPVAVIVFLVTAFVVSTLLKKKDTKLKDNFGFQKVWKKYERKNSFHLYSKKDGWVNVENIWRGLLIIAGAGSGKTFSIIEPYIDQAIKNGMTGMIFDFKMAQNFTSDRRNWALTRFAYMMFIKHVKSGNVNPKLPHSAENDLRKFWVINFKDPRYSHRVNPIAPEYLETPGYANEYAMALLMNLEPKWIKERDFFANSAIGYLKAIIWFLKSSYPTMCTLPHAISIALQPYSKVLAALSINKECMEMMGSIAVAASEENAGGQLAGVDASLKTPIDKINSPEIFWVLSGNDFSLHLNDPKTPGVMCLGSDPELQDTYSPVCALIATVVKKVMNTPNRVPSFYILDEAPQLAIPKLSNLPETARSNYVSVVVCGQNLSQFISNYGKDDTDSLVANLNTQFFGQVSDPGAAELASKIIGQRDKLTVDYSESKNKGSGGSKSENTKLHKENLIQPYELATLVRGRFVGKLAEVSLDENNNPKYDAFFNILPDIESFKIDHDFPCIVKNPEDPKDLTRDEMFELMWKNSRRIKHDAAVCIDRCARTACKGGLADEQKVFPKHFQRIGNELLRVVSTEGVVMPGITGITVSDDGMFTVSGRAKKVAGPEDMIEVQIQQTFSGGSKFG